MVTENEIISLTTSSGEISHYQFKKCCVLILNMFFSSTNLVLLGNETEHFLKSFP